MLLGKGYYNVELTDIEKPDLCLQRPRFDRRYAEKRRTSSLLRCRLMALGLPKGMVSPRARFTPEALSAEELWSNSQDLLVSRELCLGQKSEEGSVPWLKGRGQKS